VKKRLRAEKPGARGPKADCKPAAGRSTDPAAVFYLGTLFVLSLGKAAAHGFERRVQGLAFLPKVFP
jgi:hypothetical protein